MKSPSRSCGFSYIELLVCTAIILILYALCLGPGTRGYELKERAKCAANLERMHLALALYAQEHEGAFPTVPGAATADVPLSLLVPQYTTDTSVFICPAGTAGRLPEAAAFAGRRISYAYYMGVKKGTGPESSEPLVSDAQINVSPKRAGDVLFAEKHGALGGNHRQFGGNILFADGHVEAMENKAARDLLPGAGAALLNPIP